MRTNLFMVPFVALSFCVPINSKSLQRPQSPPSVAVNRALVNTAVLYPVNSNSSAQQLANGRECTTWPGKPVIFGLRCDASSGTYEGALIIKANEPTTVILIGGHLDSNVSLAITSERKNAQADCTHADRVRSFKFEPITSNVAKVVIDVPAQADKKPYYLCLRDSTQFWHHQGDEPWLQLYVKEDLLPVFMKIIVIACLLMLSGLFSGLNLGLMALDKNELQVIISCGSETEKRYARAIEPVRRRGNYLLCSILFSNVLVNSTIAVLLEELTSGIVAVITSTIFIVMFGEILPQAFCSRHGLAVGAKTVAITYFCMVVTFPLSYPISWCLDWALGEEIGHAYDRERLMEFIRVTRDYNNLETDEVNIISGALKLKRIPVSEAMTRIEDVFMLDMSSCLDFQTIQSIIERGYSRIPVHEQGNRRNIIALLFAKDLALLDPDDKIPVQIIVSFYYHPMMHLFEDTTLDLALNEFKTGRSHLAFVRRVIDDGDLDPVYEITGIVTLEDVIEEIMQMEINDETDILSDNRRKRRRKDAQIRGDLSQFVNFGAGETSANIVTPQLCLAAYQFLAASVEPFSTRYISDSILRRLLSQKIYFKVCLDQADKAQRRLFSAGEPANHFIMILEGRVRVSCGKEGILFESGPFSYFGKIALSYPSPCDKQPESSLATFHNTTRESSNCKPLESEKDNDLSSVVNGRQSSKGQRQGESSRLATSMGLADKDATETGAASTSVQSLDDGMAEQGHHIISDYSVEIVADTSYLKITRNEYLAALRTTIVERETALNSDSGSGGSCKNHQSDSDNNSLLTYPRGATNASEITKFLAPERAE